MAAVVARSPRRRLKTQARASAKLEWDGYGKGCRGDRTVTWMEGVVRRVTVTQMGGDRVPRVCVDGGRSCCALGISTGSAARSVDR
eukprot:9471783-Pyramimonas_sp.AAC.1